MARIAGIDLPRGKRVEIALTYIYGIGVSRSNSILGKAGIDPGMVRLSLGVEDASDLIADVERALGAD